ncbi:MAG: ATP-binding cassette domain-containing protein, partial [Lachnospiraceae bacterium]|nr:ATP-binding cassette domain-containing protein [Lachnospiraceae bacterium]
MREDICIRNITKSYGEKTVFTDLNLKIESGKITCIMAPSGAGKTTLLRMMMGL